MTDDISLCATPQFHHMQTRIVELEAINTRLAKFLLELHEKLSIFVDEIEDEGDRVYLGSTNHADYLREAEERMTEIWYEQEDPILTGSKGRDLYAEMRVLNQRIVAAEASLAEAEKVIGEASVTFEQIGLTASGCASTHGDPGGGLEMINGYAEDGFNAARAFIAKEPTT